MLEIIRFSNVSWSHLSKLSLHSSGFGTTTSHSPTKVQQPIKYIFASKKKIKKKNNNKNTNVHFSGFISPFHLSFLVLLLESTDCYKIPRNFISYI